MLCEQRVGFKSLKQSIIFFSRKSTLTLTAKTPLERVQGSETLLQRLMLVLPTFRGYKLKEERREADRIVRDYIYDSLEHSRDDLMSCFQILTHNKLSEHVEPMNHLVAKLDRVAEKINRASYGYAGFFDSVRIEESDLDRMLDYDTQLTDLSKKVSEMATSFRGALTQNKFDNIRNSQLQLDDSIRSLELAFDQRKLVIRGVKLALDTEKPEV
jgi:hypothetical protein